MDEGEFRKRIKDYIDPDGLVTILPNQDRDSTGNGILHLGLLIAELHHYGWLRRPDMDAMLDTLHKCQVYYCGYSLPLVWRSPKKRNPDDYQTHDDYYGVAMLGLDWTYRWFLDAFHEHAKRWWWTLDHHRPGRLTLRFCHLWRLAWRAHIGIGTTDGASPIQNFILAASILLHFPSVKRSDSCIHTWLSIELSRSRSLLCHYAGKVWERRVRKKFGSIGNSFIGYFQSNTHPLTFLP